MDKGRPNDPGPGFQRIPVGKLQLSTMKDLSMLIREADRIVTF